jgi:hypothetical protein
MVLNGLIRGYTDKISATGDGLSLRNLVDSRPRAPLRTGLSLCETLPLRHINNTTRSSLSPRVNNDLATQRLLKAASSSRPQESLPHPPLQPAQDPPRVKTKQQQPALCPNTPPQSPAMMRNKTSTSLQKTYDECYLICSTAVYFEGQVGQLC